MDNKQRRPDDEDMPVELPNDQDENPGIGQSQGLFAREGANAEADLIEGENTVEGDVENDAGLGQGVDPDQLGRTND